ncbi:hypothetical protein COU50_02355 [bacterium CG10_big_fil_rev_8_21_14_0_10_33_18]|nr:MAG: hypothetical protein COU50_02355 [bacterium CG10_big_fil_rev_8_21_14_0_10_33_18]
MIDMPKKEIILRDVRAVIFGVRNERSIGAGIVNELARSGAKVAVFRKNPEGIAHLERLKEKGSLKASYIGICDVTNPAEIEQAIQDFLNTLSKKNRELDFVVHSLAGVNNIDAFKKSKLELDCMDYIPAIEISALSLLNVIKTTLPVMADNSSYVSISFMGGEKCLPNYHPMDVAKAALEQLTRSYTVELIEKNISIFCISAPPIKTISAKAISDFHNMLKAYKLATPFVVDQQEVGRVCVALASGYLKSLTGSVLHADGGFHVIDSLAEIVYKNPNILDSL